MQESFEIPYTLKRKLFLASGLVLVTSLVLADSALAELAPAAEEDGQRAEAVVPERVRARFHFNEGLRLMDQEAWDAALAEFEESIRLHPNPTALFNTALCLSNLSRIPAAYAALRRYLELTGERLDPEERGGLEEELARIRARLTELIVIVDVEGAQITVDGEEAGESPLDGPLLIDGGTHSLEVSSEGHHTARRQVEVVVGPPRTELFELEEISRPPRQASLRVESNAQGADVVVDGRVIGTVPHVGLFDEGDHRVELRAEGYLQGELALTLRAGGEHIVTIPLARSAAREERFENPRRRIHRAWFWSMIGLTATGALTTVGLGVAVHVADRDYESTAPDAARQYDRGQSLMMGFDVALGAACVTAVGALLLALFTEWRRPGGVSSVERVRQ